MTALKVKNLVFLDESIWISVAGGRPTLVAPFAVMNPGGRRKPRGAVSGLSAIRSAETGS